MKVLTKITDFIGVLFLLLLTTGWFLIPDYFKYIIMISMALDLIGLLLNNKYVKIHAVFVSLITIFNLCALHYEWLRYGYLIVGTLSLMGFIVLKYGGDLDLSDDETPIVKTTTDIDVLNNKVNGITREDWEKVFIPRNLISNETLIEKFVKFNNKVIISEYEDTNKKIHYHVDLADNEEDTKSRFIDLMNQSIEWIHLRQKNEKKSTMLDFYITLCQPFDFEKLDKIWKEPKEEVK